jgi:hypothetical protein
MTATAATASRSRFRSHIHCFLCLSICYIPAVYSPCRYFRLPSPVHTLTSSPLYVRAGSRARRKRGARRSLLPLFFFLALLSHSRPLVLFVCIPPARVRVCLSRLCTVITTTSCAWSCHSVHMLPTYTQHQAILYSRSWRAECSRVMWLRGQLGGWAQSLRRSILYGWKDQLDMVLPCAVRTEHVGDTLGSAAAAEQAPLQKPR